jgi:hypothetical protein
MTASVDEPETDLRIGREHQFSQLCVLDAGLVGGGVVTVVCSIAVDETGLG